MQCIEVATQARVKAIKNNYSLIINDVLCTFAKLYDASYIQDCTGFIFPSELNLFTTGDKFDHVCINSILIFKQIIYFCVFFLGKEHYSAIEASELHSVV